MIYIKIKNTGYKSRNFFYTGIIFFQKYCISLKNSVKQTEKEWSLCVKKPNFFAE